MVMQSIAYIESVLNVSQKTFRREAYSKDVFPFLISWSEFEEDETQSAN